MTRSLHSRDIGTATLVVSDRVLEPGVIEWLLGAISSSDAGLALDRARSFEPVNQPYLPGDSQRIARQWDGGPFYLRSTSTKVWIAISPSLRAGFPGTIDVRFPAKREFIEHIGDLLSRISGQLGGELGFIELVGKEEALAQEESGASFFTRRDASEWSMGIHPIALERSLPDIYWRTYFGQPYIEEIGRERLLSAPAFRVFPAGENLVGIQLTEDPLDAVRFAQAFLAARDRVRQHLGNDLFFHSGDDGAIREDRRVPQLYLQRRVARAEALEAAALEDVHGLN